MNVAGQSMLAYRYNTGGYISSIDQLLAQSTDASDPNSMVRTVVGSLWPIYDAALRITALGNYIFTPSLVIS